MRKAFTLLELLVGTAIFMTLATITVLAGIESWNNFFVTRAVQEETSLLLESLDRIQGTVRKAVFVPTDPIQVCPVVTLESHGWTTIAQARPITDCTTFTQSPTTLYLRVPSINADGTIISGSYDTVIYGLVGGDLVEVQRRTAGARDNHDQDLVIAPSSVNFTLTTVPRLKVTATIERQVTTGGRTVTRSFTRTMGGRNAQ